MSPVAMIVINLRKEFWLSRESYQGPPVLKFLSHVRCQLSYGARRMPKDHGIVFFSLLLDKKRSLWIHNYTMTWFVEFVFHNPDFKRPQERSILKTFWEMEKMLVTCIFSFSHNVFYHILYNCVFYHILYNCDSFSRVLMVVCKCFQFGPV